jgi:hypothetical protein
MHSRKYPRTFHFPFSPGTTSDDRIAKRFDALLSGNVVITEKLDGENTCLNQYGVFARSHTAPTRNPWANYLWDTWNTLHRQLGDLELFGESLYAVHSIRYSRLESYFYLFGIRDGERWLAWEEVEFYAGVLGLLTVPVLYRGLAAALPGDDGLPPAEKLKASILGMVAEPSSLSDPTIGTTPREGAVARVARSFTTDEFPECVFKWVRKGHVQTDEHWTRNWQRARLHFEMTGNKLKTDN